MGSATNANAMAASTTSSDQQMEVDAITNARGFLKGNPNQWRLHEAPVTTAAAATTAAAQAPHKDAQLVFTVDATDITSMAKGSPILIPNGHGHEDLFNMTETVQTCMCKNRRRRQITCLKCVTFGRYHFGHHSSASSSALALAQGRAFCCKSEKFNARESIGQSYNIHLPL